MKRFLLEESARLGVCPNTVHTNIKRGNYIGMKIKRVNARVVFVVEPGKLTRKPDHPFNSRYGINWRQVGHKEGVRLWRMKTGRTTRPQIRNRTTTTDL